uniref:Uncharacterized protein n=2 Tax=Rubus yellow net virus TaxID=198310 RepID=V5TB73_9VIRU|nr:hypothetical protein [Rubus yellow net virus]
MSYKLIFVVVLPLSCVLGVLCGYKLDPMIHVCAKGTEVEVAGGAGDSSPMRRFVAAYAAYPPFDRHFLCITPGVSAFLLCLWYLLPSSPGRFFASFHCYLCPWHQELWCAGFVLHWVWELSLECHKLMHSSSVFSLGDATDFIVI